MYFYVLQADMKELRLVIKANRTEGVYCREKRYICHEDLQSSLEMEGKGGR